MDGYDPGEPGNWRAFKILATETVIYFKQDLQILTHLA